MPVETIKEADLMNVSGTPHCPLRHGWDSDRSLQACRLMVTGPLPIPTYQCRS